MNMSDEKTQDFKLQRWAQYEERSLKNKWYAIARFDLLIISISGGGLYIIFETFKYVNDHGGIDCRIWLMKFAAITFAIAIATNFLSQVFGYRANNFAAIHANKTIKMLTGEDISNEELDRLQNKEKSADRNVNTLNIISVVGMTLGFILLSIFYLSF